MNNDRIRKIIELRKQKKTYQEIGDVFGITRERIRQILVRHAPRELIGWQNHGSLYYEVICNECDSKIIRRLNHTPSKDEKFYCNKKCFGKHIRVYTSEEEGKKERNRRYMLRYHNDPAKKKAVTEATVRWRRNKYRNDPEWREKQIAYRKEWELKRRKNIGS